MKLARVYCIIYITIIMSTVCFHVVTARCCILWSSVMRNVLLQERIVSLPPEISADHYLEFLDKEGPSLLDHTQNTDQMLSNKSKILFKFAQDLKVFKPTNPTILDRTIPDFDITCWGRQKHRILTQLKHEMRLVRSRGISSGVYVLSLTPFQLILELMAEEFREKMRSRIPPSPWIIETWIHVSQRFGQLVSL